jgi:2-oxoisovalerate dehydrogenase E1 component beta subunit
MTTRTLPTGDPAAQPVPPASRSALPRSAMPRTALSRSGPAQTAPAASASAPTGSSQVVASQAGSAPSGPPESKPGEPTAGGTAWPAAVSMAKALGSALHDAMAADGTVVVLGEDIGRLGGVFRITDGLQDAFGADRVVDTPLGESGIVGAAIGLAMRGYRPVCEIQFDGFVYPALDQIITQLARLRQRSGGHLRMPVTIRIPYGGGIGAVEHHSESPEVLFAHTPGLRVVTPATATDAYTLLRQAIASDDPVIFFEPKRRYWDRDVLRPRGGLAASDPVGSAGDPVGSAGDAVGSAGDAVGSAGDAVGDDEAPPIDQAAVVRPGTDVTLFGYGPTVRTCLDAAAAGAAEGRSIEVVDLRSLAPIDWPTLAASLRRTGRAVVVHEAPVTAGVGAEIAARLTEVCFHQLEAPIGRVGGYHTPYPTARLERYYLPDLDRVLDAVDRTFTF